MSQVHHNLRVNRVFFKEQRACGKNSPITQTATGMITEPVGAKDPELGRTRKCGRGQKAGRFTGEQQEARAGRVRKAAQLPGQECWGKTGKAGRVRLDSLTSEGEEQSECDC